MTRIKEPTIGTTCFPDYKSPISRIARSLRKGYDNVREKLASKSQDIQSLQGKVRDLNESRDHWKERAKLAEKRVSDLEQEKQQLEEELKKKHSTQH
jgi:predicted  nucleic acid-binding Zn-ribbon protein